MFKAACAIRDFLKSSFNPLIQVFDFNGDFENPLFLAKDVGFNPLIQVFDFNTRVPWSHTRERSSGF